MIPPNPAFTQCPCTEPADNGSYACFNSDGNTSDVSCNPSRSCVLVTAYNGEYGIKWGGPVYQVCDLAACCCPSGTDLSTLTAKLSVSLDSRCRSSVLPNPKPQMLNYEPYQRHKPRLVCSVCLGHPLSPVRLPANRLSSRPPHYLGNPLPFHQALLLHPPYRWVNSLSSWLKIIPVLLYMTAFRQPERHRKWVMLQEDIQSRLIQPSVLVTARHQGMMVAMPASTSLAKHPMSPATRTATVCW